MRSTISSRKTSDCTAKRGRLGVGERVADVHEAISLISDLGDISPPPPPEVSPLPAYALDRNDAIFDSFRADYLRFDEWLQRCQREHRQSWMINGPRGALAAVVIVNPERDPPAPASGRVLKICTMKVADDAFGLRYGELLLKVVFEYAVQNRYEWLYVTAFEKHAHLIQLLEDFGFLPADDRKESGELQFVKPMMPPRPTAPSRTAAVPHSLRSASPASGGCRVVRNSHSAEVQRPAVPGD